MQFAEIDAHDHGKTYFMGREAQTYANLSFLENPDPAIDNRGLLHGLFEQSGLIFGDNKALECASQELTYADVEGVLLQAVCPEQGIESYHG